MLLLAVFRVGCDSQTLFCASPPARHCVSTIKRYLSDMNVIEQAKDIIATLEDFVNFTEPDEVEEDYAQRIREAYELLIEY